MSLRHLIPITLDLVFNHLQKDKQGKQRHSLCEAGYEKTREFQAQLSHYGVATISRLLKIIGLFCRI